MNIAPTHRRILWFFRVALKRKTIRVLYRTADAIGYCVALTRYQIIPSCQILWQRLFGASEAQFAKTEPAVDMRLVKPTKSKSPPIDLREEMIRRSQDVSKPYNYIWAVERLDELTSSGINDPVAYFNNEMTDWWLAPGAMMEDEADFLGIAVAIEERWYK